MPKPVSNTLLVGVGIGTAAAAIVAVVFGYLWVWDGWFNFDQLRHAGSVDAEYQNPQEWTSHYGFGQAKRFLVINITGIGGLENIHPTDKKHATMRVYGDSLHADEPSLDGSTLYDIGIEYKGTFWEQVKGNRHVQGAYSFGLWKWDSDKEEWDDDDDRLFFAEKLEDFVLRPGAMDPTLVRDFAAPDMAGASYERALVEVLFVHPKNRVTYEGVFIFAQHIKRRMLDKNGHIASKGKKSDCDDVDDGSNPQTLVDETLLHFEIDPEHDEENCLENLISNKNNFWAKYPKCKHFEDDDMTRCGIGALYAAAFARMHDVVYTPEDADPPPPELALPATMHNMGRVLIAELLLLDEGFGFESEHMFAAPLENGEAVRELQSVLWDHDEFLWRSRDPDDDDVARFERLQTSKVATMWLLYSQYEPFLALVRSNGATWTEAARATMQAVIDVRRHEYESGYWDRHQKRWGFFGKWWMGKTVEHGLMYFPRRQEHLRTKATPDAELDFMEDWLTRKARSVSAWTGIAQAGQLRFVALHPWQYVLGTPSFVLAVIGASLAGIGILTLLGIWAYNWWNRSVGHGRVSPDRAQQIELLSDAATTTTSPFPAMPTLLIF